MRRILGHALDKWLRAGGSVTPVRTGCASEFCVDSTLQDAAGRGYRSVVITDGPATGDRPVLRAGQVQAYPDGVCENLLRRPGVSQLRTEDVTFAGGAVAPAVRPPRGVPPPFRDASFDLRPRRQSLR